jgi:membrane-bound lytic murein transglycosylase B
MKNITLPCLLLLATGFASAQVPNDDFQLCLQSLAKRADERGLTSERVQQAFANIQRRDRVIELDRSQPEFAQTFKGYSDARVNTFRIQTGKALAVRYRELLAQAQREYGVPSHYLLSFWGLETNYGSYFGNMPVLDSLATLACDDRRSAFFTSQFLDALQILDEGAISAPEMRGSWAGAMGHTQFMPSVFLAHAIDYDSDGRRDLWGSVADGLGSAANYLNDMGWKPGQRWGREVRLPADFNYQLSGLDQRAALDIWAQRGVRRADGGPLPIADMQAALIVPSGHRGPAFLVYDNFDIILRWNRSIFYALSVGLLADHIAGRGGLVVEPPASEALTLEQVSEVQTRLNTLGYSAGEVDGRIGPATRAAAAAFQADQGAVADGFVDIVLLERLRQSPPISSR